MVTVTFEPPAEDMFSSVQKALKRFTQELRLATAVKWYEIGLVSQSRTAEIRIYLAANLSRH